VVNYINVDYAIIEIKSMVGETMKVNGNIIGIKDVYLEALDKLYDMDAGVGEAVSEEILDILASMTSVLNKEISIFINRRGKVLDVSVGDYSTVSLPLLDCRRGDRRLSGVRCVHTHPESSGQLSVVDISALASLRLDCMVAIGVKSGRVQDIYVGHLNPVSGILSEDHVLLGPYDRETVTSLNIPNLTRTIEKKINTCSPELTDDGKKEKVILVGLDISKDSGSSEDLIDELEELAKTSGAEVLGKILQKRSNIDTAYYIGSGKAQELSLITQAYDIDTVIFDDELSGAQVRNLEEAIGTKVVDRTTLILDIFAKRALTREGKLQVELAQLKYRLPRLIGLGKVLSRTGGGIGTRGPGEKKLETDRRHIRERIDELEDALLEVRKNRDVQREKRKASSIPVISLIGYTNSGKSTLRNYMSRLYQPDSSIKKEDVLEANMLFATLDPTTRLIKLPKGHEVLVSDTVGFIRKLPHDLVNAFRSTLEEVVYSNMLIHVVDSSAPNAKEQIDAVNNVLEQLNALDKPCIIALNKIDRVSDRDTLTLLTGNLDGSVEISALYGNGIAALVSLIEEKAFSQIKTVKFRIPYDRMSVKSNIYKECRVVSEDYDESSVILSAEVDEVISNKYDEYIIK